jgi:hypothetical protein
MERLCNRIAGQLEFYLKRSATFQRDFLIGDLCALLNLSDDLAAGKADVDTVGTFRKTYRPVAQLELWGLGAYGWHSTGGYVGATVFFYCPEQEKIYTYVSAMPDTVSTIAKIYNGGAPWDLSAKFSSIVCAKLLLSGGKVTEEGQLSGVESGKVQTLGAVDFWDTALDSLRYDDFERLLETLWQRSESGEEDPMPAILIASRTEPGSYNKITQTWTMALYDQANRRLLISVRYENATHLILDNLARLEKEGALAQPELLVRVSLTGSELTAFPVTLYRQEGNCQLGLDAPKSKQKIGEPLFDWGDPR